MRRVRGWRAVDWLEWAELTPLETSCRDEIPYRVGEMKTWARF